jgi:hypothetical protein
MVLEFKIGDKVLVNGEFDGKFFKDVPAVIKYMNSNNCELGKYITYCIEYNSSNGVLQKWWVVTRYEKSGPTKLKMTKIENVEPIKEEDIEWF